MPLGRVAGVELALMLAMIAAFIERSNPNSFMAVTCASSGNHILPKFADMFLQCSFHLAQWYQLCFGTTSQIHVSSEFHVLPAL